MKPAKQIIRILRALRRRMMVRDFLGCTVRATLFFQGILLVLTAAAWWMDEFLPNPADIPFVLGWPFAFGAAGGLLVSIFRIPALEHVAQTVDFLGATRDRLLTGLQFSRKSNASEMESLAAAEAASWLRGGNLHRTVPIRAPRELRWLAAPLAMLALLWWDAIESAAIRDHRAVEETAEIADTAGQLDRLAGQLDRKGDVANEVELKWIAERLKQSAEQMRAEATRGGDARRMALRELATLEELVKELRRPEAATPDELKALADALMKYEQTREAAKDIQSGNLAGAAEKLEQSAQNRDPVSDQQMRQTIQQALDHLAAQKEQVSRQIEKLREQAQADEGGRRGMLQQIADLLNELQQQGKVAEQRNGKGAGENTGGKRMTDDDLKKLLGALQNLKNQQQEGPSGGEPQEGEGDSQGQIAMLNFGKGKEAGDPSGEGASFPSGQPGTEKDKGTTEHPFGKQGAEPKDAGAEKKLSGMLAAGESLSVLIPSAAAGDVKAARRYKELYQAAAADAGDTVTQEDIPLGSRFLIKRYFEAIRPK